MEASFASLEASRAAHHKTLMDGFARLEALLGKLSPQKASAPINVCKEEAKPIEVPAPLVQKEEVLVAELVQEQICPQEEISNQIFSVEQICPPHHLELVPVTPSKMEHLQRSQGEQIQVATPKIFKDESRIMISKLNNGKETKDMTMFIGGNVLELFNATHGGVMRPFDPGVADVRKLMQGKARALNDEGEGLKRDKSAQILSQGHFGKICPPLQLLATTINPNEEKHLYSSKGVQIQSAPPKNFKAKVLIFSVHLNKGNVMTVIALFPNGEIPVLHSNHGQRTWPFDPGRMLSLPRTKVGVQLETKQEKYFFEEESNRGTIEYVLNYIDAQLFSAFGTSKDTFMPHEQTTDEGPNLDLEDKVGFKGGGIVRTLLDAPKVLTKAPAMPLENPRNNWDGTPKGPESGPGQVLPELKSTHSDLLGQTTELGKSGSTNVIEIAKEWDDITKPEERPKELAGTSQSAYTQLGDAAGKAGLGGNTPSTRKGTRLGIDEAAPGQIHGTRPSIDEDSLGQVNTQSFMHLTSHKDTRSMHGLKGTRFMYGIYEELTMDHDQEISTSQVNHEESPRRMNPCARSVHPQEGMNPSQSMNQALMAIHLLKLAFMAHVLASPSAI